MTKFVRFLQYLVAIVVGAVLIYDIILDGVTIFDQKYVILTTGLALLLELALYVIYKLIEDD